MNNIDNSNKKLTYKIEDDIIFEILNNEEYNKLKDKTLQNVETEPFSNLINPICKELPMLGINITNFKQSVFTFSPETRRKLANKTYKLLEQKSGKLQATAMNNGKIVENAVLESIVKPSVAIAMIWQVAAVITAQKFLNEINEKLRKIENVVGEIRELLKGQELSRIYGRLRYLIELAEIFKSQNSVENRTTYHTKLEDIEQNCFEVEMVMKKLLDESIKKLKTLSFYTSGGTRFDNKLENRKKEIQGYIKSTKELFFANYIVIITRLLNLHLQAHMPINEFHEKRLEKVKNELYNLNNLRQEFTNGIEYKIPNFKARYSYESYDKQLQSELKESLDIFRDKTKAAQNEAENTLNYISSDLQNKLNLYNSKTEEFLISINENGEIYDVKQII